MISFITAEMHHGAMRKVEVVTYTNNITIKRIYDTFADRVPYDIIWVNRPAHLDLFDIIESREARIYGNK